MFEIGKTENVPVLDLSARLSGQRRLFEDHVHTTAAGSEALGQAAAELLAPIIGRARDARGRAEHGRETRPAPLQGSG